MHKVTSDTDLFFPNLLVGQFSQVFPSFGYVCYRVWWSMLFSRKLLSFRNLLNIFVWYRYDPFKLQWKDDHGRKKLKHPIWEQQPARMRT